MLHNKPLQCKPKGYASPCTISSLCKIAALQRAHPVANATADALGKFNLFSNDFAQKKLHKKTVLKKNLTSLLVFLQKASLKKLLSFLWQNNTIEKIITKGKQIVCSIATRLCSFFRKIAQSVYSKIEPIGKGNLPKKSS